MAGALISIADINLMPHRTFVDAFGDVAEHSPWVADRAAARRPFSDRRAMTEAFLDAVLEADAPMQLALIRSHPDLAGRVKIAELEPVSRREQQGAGLDRLTAEEFRRFTELNETYKARFGFPFIFAVKGADKESILTSFQHRIGNDPEVEFATAIRQICNIVGFRIEDRVAP